MADDFGLKIALEELRNQVKGQNETMDMLRSLALSALGSSSLLLGILSTLWFGFGKFAPQYQNIVFAGGVILILLYSGIVVISLLSINPQKWRLPLEPNYDTIIQIYYHRTDEEVLLQEISNYLDVLEINQPKLEKRLNLVRISGGLLAAMIIIMVGMSLMPRG